MNKEEREDYIKDLCAFHHCDEGTRKVHTKQFVERHWHPHPLSTFKAWWEPTGFAANGASKGGHTEAWRCWIKRETKERRWYGLKTEVAWNDERYRAEFRDWVRDGMDESHHDWDSTTAPENRMTTILRECRQTINKGWAAHGQATSKRKRMRFDEFLPDATLEDNATNQP
jgi:hypothetical protein